MTMLRKVQKSLMLAALTFTIDPAIGQVMNYNNLENLKNYSIEQVPGGSDDDMIAAGTIFGTTVSSPRSKVGEAIHFLYLKRDGQYHVSSGGAYSVGVRYDFPEYADVRCVDIVPYTNTEAIIVAQARADNHALHGSRDIILVLTVDIADGTLLSTKELAYTYPIDGDYGNIYALHAIYHEDKSNNNSYLYICGYDAMETQIGSMTSNGYPGFEPAYGPLCFDKRILVMKYDIDNHAGSGTGPQVLASRTWDYPWVSCVLNFNYPVIYDFDMAMRLVPLNDGTGDIYVTGSTNSDYVYETTGPFPTSYPKYGSATLSLRIDETDAGGVGLNTVALRPFIEREWSFSGSYEDDLDMYEHGYGAFEDNTGNGLYVFSNVYEPNNTVGYGYKTMAEGIRMTYIDKATLDFNNSTGDQHRVAFHYIDYNWGTQVMPSLNGNNKLYLVGLQSGWDANCGAPSSSGYVAPASPSNINPFMSEIEPVWSVGTPNTIGINNVNFWNTYFTSNGTTYFDDLGGGLSNITWSTEFAVAKNNGGISYMSFMGPIKDKVTNSLNVKYTRTDAMGNITSVGNPICDNSYQNCLPQYSITDISDGWEFSTHTEAEPLVEVFDGSTPFTLFTASPQNCVGTGQHKPTSIPQVVSINDVVFDVYPNPAQSFVNVKLNGVVGEDVQVTVALYNVMGQQVAELYTGAATGLETERKLDLPSVSSGVYMLIISSEGVDIQTERLSIH